MAGAEKDPTSPFSGSDDPELDPRPEVRVLVFSADSRNPDRSEVSNQLCDLVESHGLGEWIAGGQGTIGDAEFFDVTFIVEDLALAVPPLLNHLRDLGAGPSTEIIETSSEHGTRIYTLSGQELESATF